MHLIEIFVPLSDNEGVPFASSRYSELRSALTSEFGGLTAFTRAPAEGTEKDRGRERRDELIVYEVMVGELDKPWWKAFRQQLETVFKQDQILIRASNVVIL
jgi:1,4-alpha-glucan branching enzyme